MKEIKNKTITFEQLECMAELFTHAMREIAPESEFVLSIDKFLEHIKNYLIACDS